MNWRGIIESILLVLIGIAVIYLGGLARPYEAFGGEDLAGIAIIIYGIIPERKERRQ